MSVNLYNATTDTLKNVAGDIINPKSVNEMIAPIEDGTASKSYAVGEQFIMNDLLCEATQAIAQGDTMVIGTNCEESEQLSKQIKDIKSDLASIGNLGSYISLKTLNEPKSFNWSNYRFIYLCFRVNNYLYASSGVLIPTELISNSAFSRYELSLYESPNSNMSAIVAFYSNYTVSFDTFTRAGFDNFSDILVYGIK